MEVSMRLKASRWGEEPPTTFTIPAIPHMCLMVLVLSEETGLIDSTGILQVVVFLEDKYGITVGDEDLVPANLDSVENIAKFVTRKKGG
jgi:hypothetical protein